MKQLLFLPVALAALFSSAGHAATDAERYKLARDVVQETAVALWQAIGPHAPFVYGATMAAPAALLLLLAVPAKRP